MDLISVIIPTYNREKTIFAAVDSVLKQDYKNIELIIVDDHSDDNTIDILKGIKDNRLSYHINNENKGACYSRNLGIHLAKGKYIAFQDSDDIWLKNKLSKNYEALIRNNVDFVFSALRKIYSYYDMIVPSYNLNNCDDKEFSVLLENCASTQTMFGRRECFLEIQFDEELKRYQDWDLFLRIIKKYNVFYIDEPLVVSYVQKDSISNNYKSALSALKIVYKKNQMKIESNNDLKCSFDLRLARIYEKNNLNGKHYFKKAISHRKNFFLLIEYVCSCLRIYNIIEMMKKIIKKILQIKFSLNKYYRKQWD